MNSVPVPRNLQEERIKRMREIFLKNNFTIATKTWVTPFANGDINTIDLANKYGYEYLMTNVYLGALSNKYKETCDYNGTIVTTEAQFLGNIATRSLKEIDIAIENHIAAGERVLTFGIHPADINDYHLNKTETTIQLLTKSKYYPRMKFGFFSDILTRKYYDNLQPCPEGFGIPIADICGTGYCNVRDWGENPENCPEDCDYSNCGDKICDWIKGETEINCPSDCINWTTLSDCNYELLN
jgi:hypothetical protein